jgi:hypothetical protein
METTVGIILAILGTLGALAAVVPPWLDHWEKHPKQRRHLLIAGGVLLLVGAVMLYYGRKKPVPPQAPEHKAASDTSRVPPNAGGRDSSVADTPRSEAPPAAYDAWLRKSDLTIFYNAARLIEGGCTEGTVALGDFSQGGWSTGPVVECRPDGWLAFDTRPLIAEPGFFLDHTYCVNFRNALGNWGQHGGPRRAPGMDLIGVPAAGGEEEGITVGFRVTRTADGHELQFTKQGVAHCQG